MYPEDMNEDNRSREYNDVNIENNSANAGNGGVSGYAGVSVSAEGVMTLEDYYNRDKKKIFFGGVFFAIIVAFHIANGLFIKLDNVYANLLETQLPLIIFAIIYMCCYKENPLKFMRFKKFHLGSAFLIPVLMICILPTIALVNLLSMLFTSNEIQSTIDEVLGGGLLVSLGMVALLPAVVEETVFRGAIYHSFRGCHPVRAIILSAFTFGFMHMNFNQFLYATVLGIVLGFLLEATGSILSTMILHFCFNGLSVCEMWALPKLYDYLEKVTGSSQYDYDKIMSQSQTLSPGEIISTAGVVLPVAVVFLVLGFLVFWAIAKLNKRWDYIKFLFDKSAKPQRDQFPKPSLFNPFTLVGFIMCLVICILNQVW